MFAEMNMATGLLLIGRNRLFWPMTLGAPNVPFPSIWPTSKKLKSKTSDETSDRWLWFLTDYNSVAEASLLLKLLKMDTEGYGETGNGYEGDCQFSVDFYDKKTFLTVSSARSGSIQFNHSFIVTRSHSSLSVSDSVSGRADWTNQPVTIYPVILPLTTDQFLGQSILLPDPKNETKPWQFFGSKFSPEVDDVRYIDHLHSFHDGVLPCWMDTIAMICSLHELSSKTRQPVCFKFNGSSKWTCSVTQFDVSTDNRENLRCCNVDIVVVVVAVHVSGNELPL